MENYEKYEEDCKEIKKTNERLLNEFEGWIKASGVSDKTVNSHISNIDFYVNEYLLYEDAIEAKHGVDEVEMFFGYWFIKKTM